MNAEEMASLATVIRESKPAIQQALTFINDFFGNSVQTAGGILWDRLNYYRYKQLIRLAQKTQKILDETGLKPKQLPEGPLIALLEDASVSASEEIHSLFAEVWASAVSDDLYQHPSFRQIISRINAEEARLLEVLGKGGTLMLFSTNDVQDHGEESWIDVRSIPSIAAERTNFYVENFIKLGVIDIPQFRTMCPSVAGVIPDSILAEDKSHHLQTEAKLTPIGRALAKLAGKALSRKF